MDAETCRQKWRVREEGPHGGLPINRGAAYLDGRLFRGTGEGDVLAYDAATGKKLWTTHLADPGKGESIPSAPIAWNGLVFIGTSGSDVYGVTGPRVRDSMPQPARSCGKPTRCRPMPRNPATRRCRRRPGRRGETPATCRSPAAAPGPPTRSTRSAGSCTSRPAIPVPTSPRRAPRREPVHELGSRARREDRHLPQSLLAGAGRFSRLGSRCRARARDDQKRQAHRRRSAEGRAAPRLRLATDQKLYATAVTTRENEDVPLSTTPTRFCPGAAGGTEWNGPAYSPDTNLFYSGTVDWCATVTLDPAQLAKKPGEAWTGTDARQTSSAHGISTGPDG